MQETSVRSLIQEDPACCGATKPVRHSYCACATLEPGGCNCRSRSPQSPCSTAREAHTLQGRVAATCCNREKPLGSNEDPAQPKTNKDENPVATSKEPRAKADVREQKQGTEHAPCTQNYQRVGRPPKPQCPTWPDPWTHPYPRPL